MQNRQHGPLNGIKRQLTQITFFNSYALGHTQVEPSKHMHTYTKYNYFSFDIAKRNNLQSVLFFFFTSSVLCN